MYPSITYLSEFTLSNMITTTQSPEFTLLIDHLYEEKDPARLKTLFCNAISHLNVIGLQDLMGLSLFQHFCILAERFESAPEIMRQVLRSLAEVARGSKSPAELFSFFNMTPIPAEIFAKEEKKKEGRKSKVPIEEITQCSRISRRLGAALRCITW